MKFESEDEYNSALIDACHDAKIDVIAVTDHYRIRQSQGLLLAARQNGIHAFPGFEVTTKDGVNLACIFDEDKEIDQIDRIIEDCGILESADDFPRGKYDTMEFLDKSRGWGAICIAPHALEKSGPLVELTGMGRISDWKRDELLARVISGAGQDVPGKCQGDSISADNDIDRAAPPVPANASAENTTGDFDLKKSTCHIKMSNVSVEGLRQAFLDPDSRIRLNGEFNETRHAEIAAIAWEGGFLDGITINLNPELNVIVGGRGVGKSTVIESIRYVFDLDAIGENTRKTHNSMVRNVLKPGTRVTVLVVLHVPERRTYMIERTVPNRAVVRDENGDELAMRPADVVPQLAVLGQHEISEIAMKPGCFTRLLQCFAYDRGGNVSRKIEFRRELEKTRTRIVTLTREKGEVEEQLAAMAELTKKLAQYEGCGIEKRLREKELLIREGRVFSAMEGRMDNFSQMQEDLDELRPLDTAFLSKRALRDLPNAELIEKLNDILDGMNADLESAHDILAVRQIANKSMYQEILGEWRARGKAVDKRYEEELRSLQQDSVDGLEFIELRGQIEQLNPLKRRLRLLDMELNEHNSRREDVLKEWTDMQAKELSQAKSAALDLTKGLKGKARIEAVQVTGCAEFESHLKSLGGCMDTIVERVMEIEDLSPGELSRACVEGKDALVQKFGISAATAERMANSDMDWKMRIEELEVDVGVKVELNVAGAGQDENWRPIEQLSKGQQATAVLLLLLNDSKSPLVLDQPEDDLDNRYIAESVVPMIREGKRKRQYVFATHNANIPVLGDAEQIVGMEVVSGSKEKKPTVKIGPAGSIDSAQVKELVEKTLEGGRNAFASRRIKYGVWP